jgi:hypothetical protein
VNLAIESRNLAKAPISPNNHPDYWATATFLDDLPAINFRLSAASIGRPETAGADRDGFWLAGALGAPAVEADAIHPRECHGVAGTCVGQMFRQAS